MIACFWIIVVVWFCWLRQHYRASNYRWQLEISKCSNAIDANDEAYQLISIEFARLVASKWKESIYLRECEFLLNYLLMEMWDSF